MAQPFQNLGPRMKRIARRVTKEVGVAVKSTAIAIDETLVSSTPVNTGKARSNWLPSLDAPRAGTIPPYTPYPDFTDPRKFGEKANATAAINAAKLTLATRTKSEQDIYITNNVEYIADLNAGNSVQAPAGFIEMALAAGDAHLRFALEAAVRKAVS